MKFKPPPCLFRGGLMAEEEEMRSFVPSQGGGDCISTNEEDGHRKQFDYCWWRLAKEFDDHGRPIAHLFPINACDAAAVNPPARVLKEMERLAMVAHMSLDNLRHKLLTYQSGDLWVPTAGVLKQDTDIPPLITVLLVGFEASGKSSLVNLMYSVLGRSGLLQFALTHSSGGKNGRTRCLEEHNVLRSAKNGFCVYDSRGLNYDRIAEDLEEVAGWMEGGIRHRQICGVGGEFDQGLASSNRFVRRNVNSVVVVASASELYRSWKGGDSRPLEAYRKLYHVPSLKICNKNPILVLTHGDELSTDERIEARVKITEFLGTSEMTGVYDIACLNEYGLLVDELDPVTAYALAEAVYGTLLFADRSHRPKAGIKDRVLWVFSWVMWSLSALFAFLAYCCSKLVVSRDHKLKM